MELPEYEARLQEMRSSICAEFESKLQEERASWLAELTALRREVRGSTYIADSQPLVNPAAVHPYAPAEVDAQENLRGNDVEAGNGPGQVASRNEVESLVEDFVHGKSQHALEGTVWEAPILAGVSGIGVGASVLTFFALAVNIFIQLLFCAVVAFNLAPQNYEVRSIWHWRETVGHDIKYMDSEKKSLVSRICSGDSSVSVAAEQQQLHDNLQSYNSTIKMGDTDLMFGVNVGPVLCTLILLCWFLFVWGDLAKTFSFLEAVWTLPYSRSTSLAKSKEEEGVAIVSISRLRRLFMSLVALVRMTVAVLLLISGSLWLARTVSIEDLILNGVALTFVLDIDELIYQALVPVQVSAIVDSLEPMPLQRTKRMTGGEPRILLTIIFATVFTILMSAQEVSTQSQMASDMLDAFCGGNRNFVVGSHSHVEVVWSAKSAPDTGLVWSTLALSENPYVGKAMGEIISGGNVTLSQEVPSIAALHERMSLRMSALPDVLFTCSDSSVYNRQVYWQSLGQTIGSLPTSCKDVRTYCDLSNSTGILARMLCPQTCGCDYVASGQVFAIGCPKEHCKSKETYWQALQDLPCTDTARSSPPSPLWKNWNRYWNASRSYWEGQLTAGVKKEAVKHLNIAERALKKGCEGVRKDRKTLCESTSSFATESMFKPINAFCPGMCSCNITFTDSCPLSCGNPPGHWEDYVDNDDDSDDDAYNFHYDYYDPDI